MKQKPEEIKNVVMQVIGRLSVQPQAQQDWQNLVEKIFTEQERRHLKVSGRKDQTVFFHVDSPAWLFQLNLKRLKILVAVQKQCPDIHQVYFKIGKVT